MAIEMRSTIAKSPSPAVTAAQLRAAEELRRPCRSPDSIQAVLLSVLWCARPTSRGCSSRVTVHNSQEGGRASCFLTTGRRRGVVRCAARRCASIARWLADVYLGWGAVVAREGGFELAAEDDPRAIDYLVEMRRYDEDCTLAAKLARGDWGAARSHLWRSCRRAFTRERVPWHVRGRRRLALERRLTEHFDELLGGRRRQRALGRALARPGAPPRTRSWWPARACSTRVRIRASSGRFTATCAPSTCCSTARLRSSICIEFDPATCASLDVG